MADYKELKENLKKLKGFSKLAGVDLEKTLAEYQQYTIDLALEKMKALIPPPAPAGNVDIQAFVKEIMNELRPEITSQIKVYVEKAVSDSETRISLKVAEAIEILNSNVVKMQAKAGGVDSNAIIQGVISILQPEIVKASQQSAEAVFAANSKAITESINTQLSARMEQAQSQQVQATQQRPAAGTGIGSLINIDTILAIKDLIAAFKGSQVATLADPNKKLKDTFELMKIINGLKLDDAQAEKLIDKLTTPEAQA